MKSRFKNVKKAVIAAAGYGTRFLPATKNQPKEMLPIIDKPIIHYLVEECVASGITDIIIVTRAGQGIMEDYFDSNRELEHYLDENGKVDYLKQIQKIPQLANFAYVRQKKDYPYGNATPLLSAAPLIDDDESFAYLFGDDLVMSKTPCLKQLIEAYQSDGWDGVVAVQEVPDQEVNRYGIVKYNQKNFGLEGIVEKPEIGKAPSNLADFGRFILNYKTIKALKKMKPGLGGELWLVDAITFAQKTGAKFCVNKIEGEWLTTGDPLRYMKTQVRFALKRKDIGEDFKKYLRSLELEP